MSAVSWSQADSGSHVRCPSPPQSQERVTSQLLGHQMNHAAHYIKRGCYNETMVKYLASFKLNKLDKTSLVLYFLANSSQSTHKRHRYNHGKIMLHWSSSPGLSGERGVEGDEVAAGVVDVVVVLAQPAVRHHPVELLQSITREARGGVITKLFIFSGNFFL